jgi:hypothetical protein
MDKIEASDSYRLLGGNKGRHLFQLFFIPSDCPGRRISSFRSYFKLTYHSGQGHPVTLSHAHHTCLTARELSIWNGRIFPALIVLIFGLGVRGHHGCCRG